MGKKLTDLTDIGTLSSGDIMHVVDVSDTTAGPEGTSKKITVGEIGNSIVVDYSNVTGKPANFTPSVHQHTMAEITDLVPSSYVHTTGSETIGGAKFFTNSVLLQQSSFNPVVVGGVSVTYDADLSASNVFGLTVTGNFELDYSNAAVGTYVFIIGHSGGPYDISFASNKFLAPGGNTPSLSSTVDAVDMITGVYNGTKMMIIETLNFANV